MNSFWKSLTSIIGESSFARTVLFVVSFTCVLAFVFQATVDIIAKALNRTTFAVRRRANTLRLPLRKIARLRRLI